MNDTDTDMQFTPVRTAAEIPESTRHSRKPVIPFEPQRELAVSPTHLYHTHDDPSVRPNAHTSVEALRAAATPTHHRHWGINE